MRIMPNSQEWRELDASRPDWNSYFLVIADAVSKRGTCKRLKVGAVLVTPNHDIISTGYNGSPRGDKHCIDDACIMKDDHCIATIHAEENVILNAARHNGNAADCTMYATVEPCLHCARRMVNVGLKRFVYAFEYGDNHDGAAYLTKHGVEVLRVLPREFIEVK